MLEEKIAPPTVTAGENVYLGEPDPSSEKNSRHHSRTASMVSAISGALEDDGIVDSAELGEIIVSVLGDETDFSGAS